MSDPGALERLKAELRRRRHPRRRDARLEDDPSHNPLVAADCPRCRGRGEVPFIHRDDEGCETHDHKTCEVCAGSGINGEVERYFVDVGDDVVDVEASGVGVVRCPRCGWRFKLTDPDRWSGRRHRRCGQMLRIVR